MRKTASANARWKLMQADAALEKRVSRELGVSPVMAGLLINRGIADPEEYARFSNPSTADLHDPFLMKGMAEAAGLIRKAISEKTKILVYGDYDVDGLAASAILTRCLRENGADAAYYIPHRTEEGYGLNPESIKRAARDGTGLIITVDCGITSVAEVIQALRAGINTIITDHHQPATLALPPAKAIVNPYQSGCNYPFKHLSGSGIAFKLAQALFGFPAAGRHLDLAALGTIADVVPLTGENRILARCGISRMEEEKKPGIKALLDRAGLAGKKLSAYEIAFMIGPRLNAPGRLGSAETSIRLLLSDSREECEDYASSLEKDNRARQRIQKDMLDSAIKKMDGCEPSRLIALSDETWHPGVIGIIASKITELYSRPAVLIAAEENLSRGSARSPGNFHILNELQRHKGMLSGLGGHSRAAGFSIKTKNISNFIRKVSGSEEEPRDCIEGEKIIIERELDPGEISPALAAELESLEPFGAGNPEPLFLMKEAEAGRIKTLKGRHMKASIRKSSYRFDCIGFNMAECGLAGGGRADLVFAVKMNRWQGRENIQLVLRDYQA